MKILRSEITGTQTSFSSNFGGKLSFLSFIFLQRAPPLLLHIFFIAPTCTTTIITLEPCALNAEFHHFKPRFYVVMLVITCCKSGLKKRNELKLSGKSSPVPSPVFLISSPFSIICKVPRIGVKFQN